MARRYGDFRFVPRDDIPHFQGGAVGFVGYDVIRFFEPKATIHSRDDLGLPEMMFVVAGTMIVFDHRFRTMRVIALADTRKQSSNDAYRGAREKIDIVLEKFTVPSQLQSELSGSPSSIFSIARCHPRLLPMSLPVAAASP